MTHGEMHNDCYDDYFDVDTDWSWYDETMYEYKKRKQRARVWCEMREEMRRLNRWDIRLGRHLRALGELIAAALTNEFNKLKKEE